MTEIHKITSVSDEEKSWEEKLDQKIMDSEIDEGFGGSINLEVRPFWKSSIIRAGIVIVAVTAVKTAGRVLIARNYSKKL